MYIILSPRSIASPLHNITYAVFITMLIYVIKSIYLEKCMCMYGYVLKFRRKRALNNSKVFPCILVKAKDGSNKTIFFYLVVTTIHFRCEIAHLASLSILTIFNWRHLLLWTGSQRFTKLADTIKDPIS